MTHFQQSHLSLDQYWRSVILYGQNTASYKFALAHALFSLSDQDNAFISLEALAVHFSRALTRHLEGGHKQTTSVSSQFLDACKRFVAAEISQEDLIQATVKLGFNNVLDAFHVVNRDALPIRFFSDERKGKQKGIRLTDELYELKRLFQAQNLPDEVEARWRLVETAWQLNISKNLISVRYDETSQLLFTEDPQRRRVDITSCRHSLNGYQKGKCFYCFAEISVVEGSAFLADVDHFLPHSLLQFEAGMNLNGVWNLVLACRDCNRGIGGKSSRLPFLKYLERLHQRNEYLIQSHHPLRETLLLQTGLEPSKRASFLNSVYNQARQYLIHQWEPVVEHGTAF